MVDLGRKIKEAAGVFDNLGKFEKFSKLKASYVEYDKFMDSNLHQGYFCYNCIYWVNSEGGKCMLVKNDGPDVLGKVTKVIAPHGCCAGYEPNYDKIDDTRKNVQRKKLTTTDVTDITKNK
jgi:hypothetical protein